MGHIPDDDHFDEFMNASAEEWSKPEEPTPQPKREKEKTNRWGSPIPAEEPARDSNRWGSEPLEPSRAADAPQDTPQKEKGRSKWWVIAIIIVVVLCLCLCLALFALPAIGLAVPWRGLEIFEMLP